MVTDIPKYWERETWGEECEEIVHFRGRAVDASKNEIEVGNVYSKIKDCGFEIRILRSDSLLPWQVFLPGQTSHFTISFVQYDL